MSSLSSFKRKRGVRKKRVVRNNFEENIHTELTSAQDEGLLQSVEYETEKLPYSVPGKYLPDFILKRTDGSKLYIETKGYFRYQDQVKMIAVKESNPSLDIRLVFYRDQPVRKGAKLTYSGWAEKNGFVYAIATVPREWF